MESFLLQCASFATFEDDGDNVVAPSFARQE